MALVLRPVTSAPSGMVAMRTSDMDSALADKGRCANAAKATDANKNVFVDMAFSKISLIVDIVWTGHRPIQVDPKPTIYQAALSA